MNEEQAEQIAADLAIGSNVTQQAAQNAQAQYHLQEQERSLADAQLECNTTLINLYRQLKQEQMVITDDEITWLNIKDEKKQRLTEDGVNRIMELMSFYINKENLLSNFNEEQINQIMLRFRLAFSANILMRYKIYFRQPSFDECKTIFKERIKAKTDLRMFAGEIIGKELDSKEVEQKLLNEYENRMEYELNKIKDEKKKEMLSEFELLFEQLSQIVYATLNRAWKGEERGSIRRHTNISEVIGGSSNQQKPQQGGNFFRWGKK